MWMQISLAGPAPASWKLAVGLVWPHWPEERLRNMAETWGIFSNQVKQEAWSPHGLAILKLRGDDKGPGGHHALSSHPQGDFVITPEYTTLNFQL